MAEGKSTAEWASANRVAERTAQRWANEPEVRAEVESIRRGALARDDGHERRPARIDDRLCVRHKC